jgi:hypothetical protein
MLNCKELETEENINKNYLRLFIFFVCQENANFWAGDVVSKNTTSNSVNANLILIGQGRSPLAKWSSSFCWISLSSGGTSVKI